MKKITIILLGLFLFILALAFILPIIFKDEIRARVDQEIANSVNAEVFFEEFSVSLFRNFPNVTASLDEFGVVGKVPFAGDTLVSGKRFEIALNLMSVLFDDQIKVNGIEMENPKVLIKVLEDGTANYDIAIEDSAAVDTTAQSAAFSMAIDHWEINNGYLIYDDRSTKFYLEMRDFNHSGSGDFTQDIFDMETNTMAENVTVKFDGVEYVTNKTLNGDVTMQMNLPESKYTFKENNVKINDFNIGFDGFLVMSSDDISMDVTFGAKNNSFKSLLSLVPGAFKEDFEDIKTEGELDFNGFVKGVYSEADSTMPAFNVALKVDNAMFQYPDLPTPVTNINIDMLVENKDGIINNTTINVREMHMDMGQNPIDGRILIEGLSKMTIDADVNAKINLAELNSIVPMENLQLKGLYTLDLKANGVYDTLTSQFPIIDANMSLTDGYVKVDTVPVPLEQINVVASVQNEIGQMEQTVITVSDFNMMMDGEQLSGNMTLRDLDNYTWDAALKGAIDLTTLTKIYPLEDMNISGKLIADIETEGQMADVEAERYDRLPTSGTMTAQNIKYSSKDMPHDVIINSAKVTFNPQRLTINNFDGASGSSDVKLEGYLSNYLGYMFNEKALLEGQLNVNSNKVNLNDWMADDSETETDTSSVASGVLEVPQNVDFEINASINEVLYDNLTLSNVDGKITINDGIARMEGVKFNSLDGDFALNGSYNTQNPQKPLFDIDFDINDLSVQEAFKSFVTIQKLAPVAENVNGEFSTDFTIGGLLGQDMMPEFSSLTGGGIIKILQASLQDSKIISGITNLTKLNDTDVVALKDIILKAKVEDGRLKVQPFDLNIGNYQATIAGSNGIDGSLDYTVKMDIPAGEIGSTVNNALAQLTGKESAGSDITLTFGVGGTYNDPKIGLAGSELGANIKDQAKEAATEAAKEAISDKIGTNVDSAKIEAENKLREEAEKRQKEAEEKARKEIEEQKQEVEEKAKNKLKDFFNLGDDDTTGN